MWYLADLEGVYTLSLTINDHPVPGSHFTLVVQPLSCPTASLRRCPLTLGALVLVLRPALGVPGWLSVLLQRGRRVCLEPHLVLLPRPTLPGLIRRLPRRRGPPPEPDLPPRPLHVRQRPVPRLEIRLPGPRVMRTRPVVSPDGWSCVPTTEFPLEPPNSTFTVGPFGACGFTPCQGEDSVQVWLKDRYGSTATGGERVPLVSGETAFPCHSLDQPNSGSLACPFFTTSAGRYPLALGFPQQGYRKVHLPSLPLVPVVASPQARGNRGWTRSRPPSAPVNTPCSW